MPDRRLILIDAMAAVYRAFYAIPELSTKSGRPTNAVFGFIRMLKQIRDVWSPTHLAVAFDGGLSDEKLALLKDYKAQRPPMPDALREQVPLVEEYLTCSGAVWVRQEKQEADDLIASMVAWARPDVSKTLIATSDKDMYQLVDQKVGIVPLSDAKSVMGPDEVKTKTGVAPSQVVEWLALVGDASDNIPGVPGIGPKTAAKLLHEHGSLEAMWPRMEEIKSDRLRKALEESRGVIQRNLAMVRLRRDIDCGVTWDQLAVKRSPDPDRLIGFLEELEFHSLSRELRERSLFPE